MNRLTLTAKWKKFLIEKSPLPEEQTLSLLVLICLISCYALLIFSKNFWFSLIKDQPLSVPTFHAPAEMSIVENFLLKKEKLFEVSTNLANYSTDIVLPQLWQEKSMSETETSEMISSLAKKPIKINLILEGVVYSKVKKFRLIKLNGKFLREGQHLAFKINNIPVTIVVKKITSKYVILKIKKGKEKKTICITKGEYVL